MLPEDRGIKVIVFRPDVRVGTLRTAGLDEPNADWTDAARANILAEMKTQAKAIGLDFAFLGDLEGADAETLNQYRSLFIAVSSSATQHGVFGNHLPTKEIPKSAENPKRKWRVDWTLGPGIEKLQKITGGDYGLFFFTHDAYGSSGRKAAVIFAAMWGVAAPFGVHEGYAGLVDLRTGDLVWFNTNPAIGGDPREAEGATKRVAQLLQDFPGSVPPPPVAAPAK